MISADQEDRILIVAPSGRDAALAQEALAQVAVSARVCTGAEAVSSAVADGAGGLLLTQEALTQEVVGQLRDILVAQPPWSDLPIVLMVSGGESTLVSHYLETALGQHANVILVERPARVATLVSAVRSALRARRRQYEVRDHLEVLARSREALRQSEQRYRQLAKEAQTQAAQLSALLESMFEAVTVFDATGKILLRNAAMRQLSRVSDERAVSVTAYNSSRLLFSDGTPVPVEQWPVNRLLTGESFQDEEYVLEREDGSRRAVISSGSAIYDEQGKVSLALVVTRDITALKRLEEAREDFVRAVSHDIRQPLTVIQGQAQMLRVLLDRPGQDDRRRHSLEAILINTKRMATMIRDMVEATRLETGQLNTDKVPVDLFSLVVEMAQQMEEADGCRHRVSIEVPDDLPSVQADATQIQRVLANLLGNALKYSPPDTAVTVNFARQNGDVVISVNDRGVGIDPVEVPHVFERYYRSREVRDTRSDGLGLGLYISRLIVEAHGGRIWVESEKGKSSTFHFSLPVAK